MSKQSTFLSSQQAFVIDCAMEQAHGAILDQNCLTKPIHVLRAEPKKQGVWRILLLGFDAVALSSWWFCLAVVMRALGKQIHKKQISLQHALI